MPAQARFIHDDVCLAAAGGKECVVTMHKIRINMLSNADKVDGQGVGSAYLEQVALVKNELSEYFDVVINDSKPADIIHCHTILPQYLMKMKFRRLWLMLI